MLDDDEDVLVCLLTLFIPFPDPDLFLPPLGGFVSQFVQFSLLPL